MDIIYIIILLAMLLMIRSKGTDAPIPKDTKPRQIPKVIGSNGTN